MRECLLAIVLALFFSQPVRGDRFYWASSSPFHFYSAELDGSDFKSVFGNAPNQPLSIALDPVNDKLYYSYTSGATRRANLDGTGSEIVRSQPTRRMYFDPYGGHLYWFNAVGNNNELMRSGPDGRRVEQVLRFSQYGVSDIALDTRNQTLYWSSGPSRALGKISFDGLVQETLLTDRGFWGLVFDEEENKLYWSTIDTGDRRIQRANVDGTNLEDVLLASDLLHLPDIGFQPDTLSLDPVDRKLLWTSTRGSHDVLFRSDLDGENIEELFTVFDVRQMVLDYDLPVQPEVVVNGDFEMQSLASWIGVEGLASIGDFPVGSENSVVALKASEFPALSQTINVSSPSFRLSFDLMFLAPASKLEVFINGTLVQDFESVWSAGFETSTVRLPAELFADSGDYNLAFRHVGANDSQVLIDDVKVTAVPEPSASCLATACGFTVIASSLRQVRTRRAIGN